MSAAVSLDRFAPELRILPRCLPYVPGFGGHRTRSRGCRCSIADELVCGRPHPDARESSRARDRRLQAAVIVAAREARTSEWRAEIGGTGAERSHDVKPAPYKRPSEAKTDGDGPARRDRAPLSDDEWREALDWMRKQRLRRDLEPQRKIVAAQAWLELRCPPVRSVFTSFTDEVRKAWMRAEKVIRKENETTWTLPTRDRDGRESTT